MHPAPVALPRGQSLCEGTIGFFSCPSASGAKNRPDLRPSECFSKHLGVARSRGSRIFRALSGACLPYHSAVHPPLSTSARCYDKHGTTEFVLTVDGPRVDEVCSPAWLGL